MPPAPGQTDEYGYDITESLVFLPRNFMDQFCENVFIEFLTVSTDGRPVTQTNLAKNHVIFKIDFSSEALGFEAVRLSMDVNFDLASSDSNGSASFKPGRLNLKPVTYKNVSRSSSRTFQLPLGENLRFGQILQVIYENSLHSFSFVNIGDRYYGCRDFIAQALLNLGRVGYVGFNITWSHTENPPTPVTSIFHALGMRWAPGRVGASPIDRGNFTDYRRIESPEIPYVGSQRAQEIEILLGRMR